MYSEEFVRVINAAKKFKIKDDFEFIGFDDISKDHLQEHENLPEMVEIWCAVKIKYDGELPESYKALNLIIGDWVEKNEKELTKVIHGKLKPHLDKHYPDSDSSDFENEEFEDESTIWLDQLDYMPTVDEKEKSLIIEIELVLNAEPLGGE